MILDGNFIFSAIKNKMDLKGRMEKLLQTIAINLFVLRSSLNELKSVGKNATQALEFAERYCEVIEDESITGNPTEKLLQLIGTSYYLVRYIMEKFKNSVLLLFLCIFVELILKDLVCLQVFSCS